VLGYAGLLVWIPATSVVLWRADPSSGRLAATPEVA
jgi:hypothetical protein